MAKALCAQLLCPSSPGAIKAKLQKLQNSGSRNWALKLCSSPRLARDSAATKTLGTHERCRQTERFPILQVIHRGEIAERPTYFQIPFCSQPRQTWAFIHF